VDPQLRAKVDRAKQIIKEQVEKNDPDTSEFVKGLLEQYPDIASISDKRWNERWAGTAKRDLIKFGIKFGVSVVAKLVREFAEKL